MSGQRDYETKRRTQTNFYSRLSLCELQDENTFLTSRIALLEQQSTAQEEAFLKLGEALEESLVSVACFCVPMYAHVTCQMNVKSKVCNQLAFVNQKRLFMHAKHTPAPQVKRDAGKQLLDNNDGRRQRRMSLSVETPAEKAMDMLDKLMHGVQVSGYIN